MARKYDAVFLDAQGTILQAHPPVTAIYAGVYRRFGGIATEEEIALAMKAQWVEFRAPTDSLPSSFDTSDEMTRQFWSSFNGGIFRRLGWQNETQGFLDGLWEAFGRPENWRLFPEVDEVLGVLRGRGYKLGIVSNWDSRLFRICDHLDLSGRTDFILASAAVGVEKPGRRIFEVALATAGTSPDRAVHVGDDYHADVLGARGAGIDAVLIDRDGDEPLPVPTIRSLRELLALLP